MGAAWPQLCVSFDGDPPTVAAGKVYCPIRQGRLSLPNAESPGALGFSQWRADGQGSQTQHHLLAHDVIPLPPPDTSQFCSCDPSNQSRFLPVLAEDAIKAALADYKLKQEPQKGEAKKK